MPQGFDGFKFIILVTCEQTNFVFAIPSKECTARAVADALIHRVFYHFMTPSISIGRPRQGLNRYSDSVIIKITPM